MQGQTPTSQQSLLPSSQPKNVGHYQLGEALGRGAAGIVYKALNINGGEFVAIKQIPLANVPKDQIVNIEMEIDLLSRLKHQNIVKYHGHIKTKDYLYIVLEFVESGSLQHVLKSFGKFPESLAIGYISQVLQGLAYLHDQGVVHRDIKGANILTTKEGVVKLADFGVAVKVDQTARKVYDVVGSPNWIAPEVIELSGASPASDIWSMGCTVIELITGKPPYSDLAPMQAMYRIVQDLHPPLPDGISTELRDFLFKCFQKDVTKRETAKQLLNHEWINSAKKDNPDFESPTVPEVIKRVFKTHMNSMSFTAEQAANALKDIKPLDSHQEGPTEANATDGKDIKQEGRTSTKPVDVSSTKLAQSPALRSSVQMDRPIADKPPPRGMMRDMRVSVGELEQALRDLESALDTQTLDEDLDIREIKSQQSSEVDRCMNILELHSDEHQLLNSCEKLALLMRDNHDQRIYLVKRYGVMPILSLLQNSSSDRVVHALLQVVNQVTKDNPVIQERVCLGGAISIIMQHATPRNPKPIRLECSIFIHQMCHATVSTLQMVMASRGIPILVDFLEPDYEESKRTIFMAIDDIISSMMFTVNAPRKDFGRLYAKCGLLGRLVNLLLPLSRDHAPDAVEYLNKCTALLLSFSNGDSFVKLSMSEQKTLAGIFNSIPSLSRAYQIKMLRVLKNLSADPITSENMERGSCIEQLVKYISLRDGPLLEDMHAESLVCLYNLCRVNPVRQEKISTLGAVKHLKHFYEIDSPLKSYALSIICDLVRASPVARNKLWEDDVMSMYLALLQQDGWQVQAMESITTWLLEEGRRVEAVIQAKPNLSKLVTLFSDCSPANFEKLLDPFQRILQFSAVVNQALGESRFVEALLAKLDSPKTHVVVSLLKMLNILYEYHKHPKAFISRYKLYTLVNNLKDKAQGSVVVQEICNLLLGAFNTNSVI